jgi:hypothetical protein
MFRQMIGGAARDRFDRTCVGKLNTKESWQDAIKDWTKLYMTTSLSMVEDHIRWL